MIIITSHRKKVPRGTWAWLAYAVLIASFVVTTLVMAALGAYGHAP